MRKEAVKISGTKVSIDLLAVKRDIEAGTLSKEDRDTIERMLPGIIEGLSAAVKHAEVKPPPLPEAKP